MLSSELSTDVKGTDPDKDLVTDIYEKRKQSESHLAEWTKDAKNWYGLVSGEQWRQEDKALLDEQGKPCVAFNRVAIVVNALCGSEANNRQEVRFLPRTIDDSGVNDLLTDAAKWVRDCCDAEDEESDAFRDAVICGYGWTETKMDYERDPQGMVVVARRDPSCFHYDPRAIKRNLSDMKWVQCDDYLDDETILSRWPDATLVPSEGEPDASSPHDATQAPFYLKNQAAKVEDKGRLVIHHCWSEIQTVWRTLDPTTGETVELSSEKYVMAAAAAAAQGQLLQARKGTKCVYKHAYVLGKELLETGDAACQYEFQYKCITGYRNRNDGTFYGLVKQIEDPQRYANKMLSQLLHMINTNAKGGLMVEENAVDDIRAFEEKWAQTESIIQVNNGALSGGKIQPKQAPVYPQAIDSLLQFSVGSIRDGSGVNLEMLGLADRTQAGIVEESRTSAGLTIVATLFDSLRQYRKQQGRLLAHFIVSYMTDGRLVRVSGPTATKYIPLLRQSVTPTGSYQVNDVLKYDVIVDDAPTARDMKAKTFDALQKIIPLVQAQGGPVPAETLDYAPIPTSLAESWKQQIQQAQQNKQPPPEVQVAQAMAQAETQKAQQAQVKGQADIQLKQIEVQLKAQDLQMQQEERQWKAQEHAMAMQLAAMKLEHERERMQMQMLTRTQPQGNA